jgi:hypothetical protein
VSSSTDRPILAAVAALNEALSETGAPAMFIGDIAVIARGAARLTVDIDAAVRGDAVRLEELLATLQVHQITPRIGDAEDLARRSQVLLLEHGPTGTPLEVRLGWLPFEIDAPQRADHVDFGGVTIPRR